MSLFSSLKSSLVLKIKNFNDIQIFHPPKFNTFQVLAIEKVLTKIATFNNVCAHTCVLTTLVRFVCVYVCVLLSLSKIQHLYYNLIKIVSKMVLLVLQSGKEGQKNPKFA